MTSSGNIYSQRTCHPTAETRIVRSFDKETLVCINFDARNIKINKARTVQHSAICITNNPGMKCCTFSNIEILVVELFLCFHTLVAQIKVALQDVNIQIVVAVLRTLHNISVTCKLQSAAASLTEHTRIGRVLRLKFRYRDIKKRPAFVSIRHFNLKNGSVPRNDSGNAIDYRPVCTSGSHLCCHSCRNVYNIFRGWTNRVRSLIRRRCGPVKSCVGQFRLQLVFCGMKHSARTEKHGHKTSFDRNAAHLSNLL